ncbi:MAG: DUF3501 family protein [Acidobacteriota bacterium]
MKALTLDDLMPLSEYERRRAEIRAATVAHKRSRRIAVGPILSFVFEDRETLRFQVLEMCRAERIDDPAKRQIELDVYNALLPSESELSATMFVELTSEDELRHWLPKLPGVEHAVRIELGSLRAAGQAEGGRSKEDATSSVHYLRFPFSPEAIAALRSGHGAMMLVVDHPSYLASTELPPDVRASLARDLAP